jgi:hypothetical protein
VPERTSFILPGHETLSNKQRANKLAEFFSGISQEYPELKFNQLPARVQVISLTECTATPQFENLTIYNKLVAMKKTQSTVDGDIPPKIRK